MIPTDTDLAKVLRPRPSPPPEGVGRALNRRMLGRGRIHFRDGTPASLAPEARLRHLRCRPCFREPIRSGDGLAAVGIRRPPTLRIVNLRRAKIEGIERFWAWQQHLLRSARKIALNASKHSSLQSPTFESKTCIWITIWSASSSGTWTEKSATMNLPPQ